MDSVERGCLYQEIVWIGQVGMLFQIGIPVRNGIQEFVDYVDGPAFLKGSWWDFM
jgi:hypothetical protein